MGAHVAEPMHNFHPATMAAIFTVPLNDDPVAEEGGWLVSTEQVCHPTSLMIKILLCSVSIHMECKYIHFYFFYPFREVYPHTSPPDFIITKFHVPSKSLATQPQPMNWYIPVITFLLPRKMNSQVPCWESCPLGGYFSSPVFQECPRKGRLCCSCSLSGDAHTSYRTISTPISPKSSLPLSTDHRELPRRPGLLYLGEQGPSK